MANTLCQTELILQLEAHQTTKCIQYHQTIKFWDQVFFLFLIAAHTHTHIELLYVYPAGLALLHLMLLFFWGAYVIATVAIY